jgi:hypothetical protein
MILNFPLRFALPQQDNLRVILKINKKFKIITRIEVSNTKVKI